MVLNRVEQAGMVHNPVEQAGMVPNRVEQARMVHNRVQHDTTADVVLRIKESGKLITSAPTENTEK